jgi:hypothetical protein
MGKQSVCAVSAFLSVLVWAAISEGLAQVGARDAANELAQGGAKSKSYQRLTVFKASEAYDNLVRAAPPREHESDPAPDDPSTKLLASLDESQTFHVVTTCGGNVPPPEQRNPLLIGAAISAAEWLIGQVVGWAVGEINTSLQNELNKYTHQWNTSTATNVYPVLGDNTNFSVDKDSKACFRYSRYVNMVPNQPHSTFTLDSDFVGLVQFDHAQPEVMTIRPVRLYYRNFKMIDVETANNTKSALISLTADAIHLTSNSGERTSNVINGTVVSSSVKQTGIIPIQYKDQDGNNVTAPFDNSTSGPIYQTFDPEKTQGLVVPLPPWDTASQGAPRTGLLLLSLTVKETGNVPWLLENAAKLFQQNKNEICKELTTDADNYAKAIIGPSTPPAPSADPSTCQ